MRPRMLAVLAGGWDLCQAASIEPVETVAGVAAAKFVPRRSTSFAMAVDVLWPRNCPKHQGPGDRLWMKIVDFTCGWSSGTSPDDVLSAIWNTSNFWTPIAAGPEPDNANGFRGRGDPTEGQDGVSPSLEDKMGSALR